jgi:hypothetical protein
MKRYKLIHHFKSSPMIAAGDAVCRVANTSANGDREILQTNFLRVLEGGRLANPQFAIVEEIDELKPLSAEAFEQLVEAARELQRDGRLLGGLRIDHCERFLGMNGNWRMHEICDGNHDDRCESALPEGVWMEYRVFVKGPATDET